MSLLVIFTSLLLFGIHPEQAEATRQLPLQITGIDTYQEDGFSAQIGIPGSIAGNEAIIASEVTDPYVDTESENWRTIEIKTGDNLADIFSREGISPQELHKILDLGGAARNLTRIYPGQTLRLLTNAEAELIKLEYQIDKLNLLEVHRTGNDFEITTTYNTPERHVTNASGLITSSLFLAAQKAGLSDNMTMELANIFGWDIDFALDIRKGDQFVVLYDELYLEGEKVGEGHILAATFINQGKTYQAVRYTDKSHLWGKNRPGFCPPFLPA